jgi:uncharacterized membrane protein YidH (DUF202 family)
MASSLIEPIARVGFAARGAVYVMVGVLAARAAVGQGRTTDAGGAVRAIGRLEDSGTLLVALGLGLAAYAVWRFAQALEDLDRKGGGVKGLTVRTGYAASGLVHLGLAATAGGFARRSGSMRAWVARSLAEPWGAWAVGLGGAAVMGAGLYQFHKAWTGTFEEHLRMRRATADTRRWSRRIGQFGLCARGVTFLIIGWFLVRAALHLNAREVKDLGDALRMLQAQEYGAWLLGIVALGLVSYGLLSLVDARYRRVLP